MRWKRWGVRGLLLVLVLLLALDGVYRFGLTPWVRGSAGWVCRTCGSHRSERWTRVFGVEVHRRTRLERSATHSDLLGEMHAFDWAFVSSTESGLGFEVHSDGFPRFGRMPNYFVDSFNGNRAFRTFVNRQIESGRLTPETARAIVALERVTSDGPTAARARALMDRFGLPPDPRRELRDFYRAHAATAADDADAAVDPGGDVVEER